MFMHKKIQALAVLGMCLCLVSPAKAGIPEIIIDGVVVQEKEVRESKILSMAKQVQEWYIQDRQAGNNWVYRCVSSDPSYRTFSEAFAAGARYTNCSDGVNKVLRECGLVPAGTGFFYGSSNGTIAWLGNAKEVYSQIADVYSYADGTTVGQLIDSGQLVAGDVVTYYGFAHTNLYMGDGYWFDTGHAHCTVSSGTNAPFWTFYSKRDNSSLKVGCIVRLRNQAGVSREPIEIEDLIIFDDDESEIVVDGVAISEDDTKPETEPGDLEASVPEGAPEGPAETPAGVEMETETEVETGW